MNPLPLNEEVEQYGKQNFKVVFGKLPTIKHVSFPEGIYRLAKILFEDFNNAKRKRDKLRLKGEMLFLTRNNFRLETALKLLGMDL